MSRLRGGAAAGLICALGGCEPTTGASVDPAAGTEVAQKRSESHLDPRLGETLELSVPLFGGGQLPLADLRGRKVLLWLSAGVSSERNNDQQRYRAVAEAHASTLVVVSVALDADAAQLPASWTDDPPPFVLAWDPQGAVAARLHAVAIPTVLLLDEQGRIAAVYEGASPEDAALTRWLADGMAGATDA